MKLSKILLTLFVSVFLFSSCTETEELPTPAGVENHGTLRIRVAGSGSASRAASEGNEGVVSSILACMWNRETAAYSLVEGKQIGDEWYFNVEEDAGYSIRFYANATDETRAALESIPEIEARYHAYNDYNNLLRNVVVDQEPDGDKFMMVSSNMYSVNTSISAGSKDLGTVNFLRLAARFDIVNRADGITINKVTFKNRTIQTGCISPLEWVTDENWYEDHEYDGLNIVGSSTAGYEEESNKLLRTIYSYRNYDMDEHRPTLEIEYTETLADGKSETRKHIVEFIDPDKEGKAPLAINQNRLYTITLTKAYKLNFEVKATDWENGEEFNETELTVNDLNISSEIQQTMNNRLAVNRFAKTYVKSLDVATGKAELFATRPNIDDYNIANGPYFKFETLEQAGLFDPESDKYLISLTDDASDKKYRVPTAGEMMLIFPNRPNDYDPDYKIPTYLGTDGVEAQRGLNIFVNSSTQYIYSNNPSFLSQWPEKISFKNIKNSEGKYQYPTYYDNSVDWMESIMNLHFEAKWNGVLFYKDSNNNSVTPSIGVPYYGYATYAVRFNGTNEYAAYKYEMMCEEEGDDTTPAKLYMSVKIKALPHNLNVSVYDVVENEEYWENDYIEICLPTVGRVAPSRSFREHTSYVSLLTSSRTSKITDATHISCIAVAIPGAVCVSNGGYASSYFYPLLLIEDEGTTSTTPGE